MKRFIAAAVLSSLLLVPGAAFAHGGYHRGGAVAWGVLGGIVGGVVLDRMLYPGPAYVAPPVVVAPPMYAPYPYYSSGPYYSGPYGGVYVRGGYGYSRGVRPRGYGGYWRRGGWRY